jgi:hypothetical protein
MQAVLREEAIARRAIAFWQSRLLDYSLMASSGLSVAN